MQKLRYISCLVARYFVVYVDFCNAFHILLVKMRMQAKVNYYIYVTNSTQVITRFNKLPGLL